jgi:hypothetical protein
MATALVSASVAPARMRLDFIAANLLHWQN